MPGYSTSAGRTLPQGTQVFNGVSMAATTLLRAASTTQAVTVPTPDPVATGRPKVYLASTFTGKPLKVWTGAAWVTKPVKVWTGSSWKTLT